MDIHSAKNCVNKLLTYVEDLSSSQPKLYSKSRDRLKEIADTCNQVVTLISDILQDEILQTDCEEFGGDFAVSEVLDNMEYQINRVQHFTNSMGDIANVQTTSPLQASSNTSEQTALSVNVRKKVFANYTACLSKLPTSSSKYTFANRCANLLWTWFDTRFYRTIPGSSFKYSMRKFPEWVQSIVVMYGKAISENAVASFEYEFQSWIDSIQTTDARDKYVVPYPVYQFCKNHNPTDLTLDAVVLWDILLDSGLDSLCTSDKQDLYLDQYSLYNMCDALNPTVLENYCDYSRHPEIFNILRWEVQ